MSYCLYIYSPLAMGKKRLVLDSKGMNEFLPKQRFKYKGFNLIPDLCGQGEKLNLKFGYHHVDIHPDCWTYLGFGLQVLHM